MWSHWCTDFSSRGRCYKTSTDSNDRSLVSWLDLNRLKLAWLHACLVSILCFLSLFSQLTITFELSVDHLQADMLKRRYKEKNAKYQVRFEPSLSCYVPNCCATTIAQNTSFTKFVLFSLRDPLAGNTASKRLLGLSFNLLRKMQSPISPFLTQLRQSPVRSET